MDATQPNTLTSSATVKDYIDLARPDHWFKNIFMLPGMVFAFLYFSIHFSAHLLFTALLGVLATCLIASANYVINEWLDAAFDRYHPTKSKRPCVVKKLNATVIYLEYMALAAIGLCLAWLVNFNFFLFELLLLIMGIIYNVKPFRTKERAYIDVLSESVNNPIRFALGWLIFVPAMLPPSSIMVAYWMGGAFLMASKRFAEYRSIANPELAARYRKSFAVYNQDTLLISMFFYALTCTFFLGIFLLKHRIELLLTFPFLALMFSWYLRISLRKDSNAQTPERLFRNWKFMIFCVCLSIMFLALLFIDIEWLSWFLRNNFG
jgi:4-hydroxybenzoate polyprenyltransferase